MDDHRFDRIARTIGTAPTRRGALRLLLGGALAGLVAARPKAARAQLCPGVPQCCTCAFDPEVSEIVCEVRFGEPCNDNNPCTLNDTCNEEALCLGTPKVCTPPNACTTSSCNESTGDCDVTNLADGTQPPGCSNEACKLQHCQNGSCFTALFGDNVSCGTGTGRICCSGACVPNRTNAQHCGTCGNQCPAGTICAACKGACSGLPAGKCCPTGRRTNCAGKCVNLKTDERNCGRCGRRCRANQICRKGECVAR